MGIIINWLNHFVFFKKFKIFIKHSLGIDLDISNLDTIFYNIQNLYSKLENIKHLKNLNPETLQNKIQIAKFLINCLLESSKKINNLILEVNYLNAGLYKIETFKTSPSRIYALASSIAYEPNNYSEEHNIYFERERKTIIYEDTPVLTVLVSYSEKSNGELETVYIIAFRGTKPMEIADLRADINIIFNKQDEDFRFDKCLAYVEFFKNIPKYKKSRIVLTGHSLGGTIAMYVASKLNLPCIVFNPGSSVNFETSINPKMAIIHKCFEDPISTFSGFSGEVFFYKTGKENFDAHSLNNFI